ncbi:XK-related protein 6-like isoform X2 [Mytilus galloprovincialis]|uniref:XK-related protein 6-like isoform X2 n=1 Tax=Mytilus galloprovincialis TaxID=29158 RepID=UPI003F7B48D5
MAKANPKMGTKKFPYTRRVKYDEDETFDEVDGKIMVKELKFTHDGKAVTSKEEYQTESGQDEVYARHINKKQNFKMAPSRLAEDEFLDINITHNNDELDGRYSILDDDTNADTKKNVSGFDKATSVALTCCCGNNCWKTNVYFNTEEYPFLFRGIDLIATVLSTVFYLYDVVSDVILAEEYYRLQRWISFGFTASLIFFPHLIMNMINISWYYRDYMAEKNNGNTTKGWKWFVRVVLSLPFMLGPIVRNVEYIYYGCKSRSASLSDGRRNYFYKNVLYEDVDAAMLRMFEAFLESAPQLVLQIYIILTETQNDNLLMQIVRVAAMFGSWVGVSWTLVSYHKALRASHNIKEQGLSFCGVIFYYIWRACEVAPRTIVLALFAAQFRIQMLIAIGIHWITMTIWLGCQKQEMMNKNSRDKWIFNIVFGYVLIFCFQNVQEGQTRYRAMFYYFVTFSENIIMLILWAYFTQHKSEWFYLAAIGTVTSLMVIQIIIQLLYYRLIHPSHKEIV